jgi:hypothetical protein
MENFFYSLPMMFRGKKHNYWASHIESGMAANTHSLNLPLGVFVDSLAVLP